MDELEADLVRIPRLRSARLLFRAFRPDDLDGVAEHFADPESARYIGGVTRRADAARIFHSCAGGWVVNGAGWWALECQRTRELVGMVGAFIRDGSPDLELGWSILRASGGRGFGTEAAERVLRYVAEERREERVIALIAHGNTPSERVAAKLGFRYEADQELNGHRVQRFARVRSR